MRSIRVRVGAVLAAVLLASSIIAPRAFAADSNSPESGFNVTLVPVVQDLVVAPGGTVSTTLKFQNKNLTTEHVQITLEKFGAEGEDGTPSLLKFAPTDDYQHWVTFSQPTFDAEPNVWKTITMTIKPPKDAAFGYYYAVLFQRAGQQTQQNQANLKGAAASLVLLDVQSPNAKKEASLVEFSTSKKTYEFLPATFTARLHNTGNVHIIPRGNVFITKGGQNVAMLDVNNELGNILPNTYRKFTVSWKDGTPVYVTKTANGNTVMDKNGKPVTTLSWSNFNMSKLRFGKYTAHLVMVYNNGKRDVPVEAYLNFWVIPWRILAISAAVLVLIIAGLFPTIIQPLRRRLQKGKRSNDFRHQGR